MNTVEIFVNGVALNADAGKTLLDNIIDNGISLPHLCHNKELESYGGCGLCVVEVEGIRKPLRACSTKISEGMRVTTNSEALEKSRKVALELILSDHSGDCKAPCFFACPTHQDVQAYVGLIANGESRKALEVIKKDNPLPASIGRVCPHPCEKKCRRGFLEGAVSICSLKRFAADNNADYIPECAPKNGKKIAVIGAGPAGLSCAYFLLIKGYSVEIFEAEQHAGGMLRYGIPAYRLPKDVLDKEIENIEKMGAVFHCNKRLGRDITVSKLKNEFDAVFVGTGAWNASALHCEGDNADGVWGGIDLLYKVANGERPSLGDNVAVVGGGNTAIDAVRTAVRLGSKCVTLIYRRTEDEMPAEKEEIADARAEGVQFKFLSAPSKVIVESGKAVGLTIQYMELGEPDASGRRSPVPIEGKTEDIMYSSIISAIGQRVITADVSELETTAKGTVKADEVSFMTSVDGVFAAGDVINKGPDIAVRAIAGGKNAARAIDCYINGVSLPEELPEYSVNNDFNPDILKGTPKENRTENTLKPADERKTSFGEACLTFTEQQAKTEAARCLECGCASVYDCSLLPLMREYDSFSSTVHGFKPQYKKDKSHPFIVRDNNKCILCALCVRACREVRGTENLGLFGRGFLTVPTSAFDLPLSDSKCVSCGACVSVCPTGALTSRTPTVKNIVLPFNDEPYCCELCDRGCSFTKRTIDGKIVKLIPNNLRECCSAGVFGPVAAANIDNKASAEYKNEILSRVKGELELFDGDEADISSVDALRKKLGY